MAAVICFKTSWYSIFTSNQRFWLLAAIRITTK